MITLLGEPKSTNHIYRYACRGNYPCMYMTKEGKDIKESYQWQLKSQKHEYKGVYDKPIKLEIGLFFGRKGKHDIDNYCKILLDSMSGIVYEDDSQIQQVTITKHYSKEKPRIEVYVLTT